MRYLLFLLCGIVVSGCVSTRPEQSDYEKFDHGKRYLVAVIPVENKSDERKLTDLVKTKSGVLLSSLAQSGRYRVIEREKLAALIQEQEFGESGIVDANSATELGKILGVDAVVLTSISRIEYKRSVLFGLIAWVRKKRVEVDMESRIVFVETGEVLATCSFTETAFDRKGYFLGLFRAGGKNSRDQLEAMAIEHAMVRCGDLLAVNAVSK